MNLEDYLRQARAAGIVDHTLRLDSVDSCGVTVTIKPLMFHGRRITLHVEKESASVRPRQLRHADRLEKGR